MTYEELQERQTAEWLAHYDEKKRSLKELRTKHRLLLEPYVKDSLVVPNRMFDDLFMEFSIWRCAWDKNGVMENNLKKLHSEQRKTWFDKRKYKNHIAKICDGLKEDFKSKRHEERER